MYSAVTERERRNKGPRDPGEPRNPNSYTYLLVSVTFRLADSKLGLVTAIPAKRNMKMLLRHAAKANMADRAHLFTLWSLNI